MTGNPMFFTSLAASQITDYVEHSDGVILRLEPETKRLVGFTIIDFSQHFSKQESDIALPFGIDFQLDANLRLAN